MIESLPVMKDLLGLAAASLGAEDAELVALTKTGSLHVVERVGDRGPIGGDWSSSLVPIVHNCDDAQGSCHAPWVGSAVAAPICGPSAELGWLVVAHPDRNRFTSANTQPLEQASRLLEHCLDRAVEGSRFDEIGMELRQHQLELRTARNQLELSNRELEQFAYIAAHELVAPLRAVAIYAEVLASTAEQHESDRQTADVANEIRTGVSHMTEQVQHLLALSRNHHQVQELESVDVSEIVHAALDTLTEPLHESGAVVTVGELPIVQAKAVPLQSVFANLLTNAIRYRRTDQQLEVKITSSATPTGLRITVADNGVGIDEADRTRVFEMFERASSEVHGSGIGLALSRRILDVFHAGIGVDENDAGGASVWLDFPDPTVTAP